MTDPQPVTDPVAFTRDSGNAWLEEARGLRDTAYLPGRSHPPGDFFAALLTTRGNLDRLEEIYNQALALRGGISRKASEMEAAAEEAWDRAADSSRRAGSRPGHEFEGPRERYSGFNLAALEPKRQARQWRLAADLASDTAERLRVMYRGLDGVRSDLATALRYCAFESNLER